MCLNETAAARWSLCLHIRPGLCSRNRTVPYSLPGTHWHTHLSAVYTVPFIKCLSLRLTDACTWPLSVTWARLSLSVSSGKQNSTADCPWEHIFAFVKCVYPFPCLLSLPLFYSILPPFLPEGDVRRRSPLWFPILSFSFCHGKKWANRDMVGWTEFVRSIVSEKNKTKQTCGDWVKFYKLKRK